MLRRSILLSALMGSTLLAPAHAAIAPGNSAERAAMPKTSGVQLAQNREVQVFYDDQGRRVLLDAQTGELITIEDPRDGGQNQWGGQQAVQQPQPSYDGRDRYNLSDPYQRDLYVRETGRDPETGQPIQGSIDDYLIQRGSSSAARQPSQGWGGGGIERNPLGEGTYDPGTTASTTPSQQMDMTPVAPGAKIAATGADENMVKLQVLLDRAGASPGVIDGRDGGNVRKALSAYEELTGQILPVGNAMALDAALEASGGPALVDYMITPEDAATPMIASVPVDYSEKAQLEHMSFTSVQEMLGERFHMDERFLVALNPDANFNRAGTIIRVASVGSNVSKQVSRIVADKGRKQVRAYDEMGNLVVAYPSTIGSSATPSPTGTHEVARVAINPEYTYNPKINFQQGENTKVLRIPPGPNGPVGTIWIALSKPTYGIHGTPEPSKIGKTESAGCVRLTNWDAAELVKLVKPGVTVEFIEGVVIPEQTVMQQ